MVLKNSIIMIQIYHPDGTVEFVEEKELYKSMEQKVELHETSYRHPSERTIATPLVPHRKSQCKSRVVKKEKDCFYNTRVKIQNLIAEYRNRSVIIRKETVSRYLVQVSEDLRDFFLSEVNSHNKYIKLLVLSGKASKKKKQNIKSKKLVSPQKASNKTAQKFTELKDLERQKNKKVNKLIKSVQETGESAMFGNFKISKLKQ